MLEGAGGTATSTGTAPTTRPAAAVMAGGLARRALTAPASGTATAASGPPGVDVDLLDSLRDCPRLLTARSGEDPVPGRGRIRRNRQ